MRFFFLFLCLFFGFNIIAQERHWRVLNEDSKEPLAFVNVLINKGKTGTSSDIDGKFSLNLSQFDSLTFSALGFKTKTLDRSALLEKKDIYLKSYAYGLDEVLILPGENPAHRIINRAIENRDLNNPEKATAFSYESYNKLVFTMDMDSIDLSLKDSLTEADSMQIDLQKFLEKQHLFLMESVTERNHLPPDFSKELVKASRISGLQNPIFSLIGTQLQSFSLYNTYIDLFGGKYLSPISKGSTNKYLFIIEDTLFRGPDTVFTISFQPRSGKNFEGLKGSISINTNGFAVENFIAEQAEATDFPVRIQQKYELVEGKQWFPVQLNTNIHFSTIIVNGHEAIGIGRSYLQNIKLESKLTKREIGNTILSMDNKAGKQTESFWDQYRVNSLDAKELETYHVMDSIGKEENLDKKIALFSTLIRGSIPWGPVDLPLNRFLDFNGYEGFRLGAGIESNQKLLSWLRLGGYGAYGFKDKSWKYGYHARWTPKSNRQFEIKGSYSNDVAEVGGTSFSKDRLNSFSSEGIQKLFINRMDKVERIQGEIGFRAFRDFHFTAFGNTESREFTNSYVFTQQEGSQPKLLDQFYQITQVGLDFRYSFREKYAEMFGVKVPVISKYPVVHAKVTKGLDGVLEGDFEFLKLDIKLDQQFVLRNFGKSSFRIAAGYVDRALPIGLLHRVKGTFNKKYNIASQYSFETAGPNEFYSSRYVNVFFRHSFGDLLFQYKEFKPELSVVSSFGIGDMTGRGQHLNTSFSTFEKGLFESGLQIDNLLEQFGLGIGAFYRYGAYQSSNWEDNVAVKITTVFNF